jgi:hypothetical protein
MNGRIARVDIYPSRDIPSKWRDLMNQPNDFSGRLSLGDIPFKVEEFDERAE